MISFIISAIIIYYAVVISLWLITLTSRMFWDIVAVVAVAVAIMVGVASKANADSIDVGKTIYAQTGYSDSNLSVGYTKNINKLFSVKAGLAQNKETSAYLMGRIEKGDDIISIGVNFGIVKQPENRETHKYFKGRTTITMVETHTSEYIYTVIPTFAVKIKRHVIELGIMPALNSRQSTGITVQYQYPL